MKAKLPPFPFTAFVIGENFQPSAVQLVAWGNARHTYVKDTRGRQWERHVLRLSEKEAWEEGSVRLQLRSEAIGRLLERLGQQRLEFHIARPA